MKYLLVLQILILSACSGEMPIPFGPGYQDFRAELPNGYMLYRTSAHQISIAPENAWSDETPVVPTKVIELAVIEDWALAKRQGLTRRSPNDPNDPYMEPDPNVFDFWILDTAKPAVWGPMTKPEFDRAIQELGLAEQPQLQDVYAYDPRN